MADNTTESMKDYEKELERSFRTINEGDIVSGSVIAVSEEEVTLDLNYYTQGIIKVENLSNDPDFNPKEQLQIGDEIEDMVRNALETKDFGQLSQNISRSKRCAGMGQAAGDA